MDEDSGMNFSEYVAVLSGNTDLLEKARLDKKITTLESEHKNFLRERDAATGKLAEILLTVLGRRRMNCVRSKARLRNWIERLLLRLLHLMMKRKKRSKKRIYPIIIILSR